MDEILIYGEIGVDITFPDFAEALSNIEGDDLTIRLHSAGGSVSDGLAIYNRIKESKLNVTFVVEGLAASMASVIAMAGKVVMPENSWLMIHKPHYYVQGDAKELRKHADDLDNFEKTLINIYQSKTNLSTQQLESMLAEETWLNASDAYQMGFVDEIIEEQQAIASLSLKAFNSAPKQVKKLFRKSRKMKKNKKDVGAQAKIELQRVSDIERMFTYSSSKYPELKAKCISDPTISEAKAREMLLKKMGEGQVPIAGAPSADGTHPVSSVLTKQNKMDAFAEALACRNTNLKPGNLASEYMGLSMHDMARHVLENVGVNTRHMGAASAIAKALHSTSDFPNLLEGAGQRILMNAYNAVPSVVKQIAKQNTAQDFRPLSGINFGEFPALEKVNEGGEFTSGTMAESVETYQLATYGRIFGITRQAIINDDLNAFAQMNSKIGQAAAAFEGSFLLNKILSNPTMNDTVALFHADHNNLGTAGALSKATLTEGRKMMRLQTGLDGSTPVDATPSYLMVPAALETEAEELLATLFPGTSDDVNPFSGSLQLLVDPRMDATSATAWYLFSDPNLITTLEYSYLSGSEGPQVTQKAGFEVDGLELKVAFDLGAGILDHRGAFKNAGA